MTEKNIKKSALLVSFIFLIFTFFICEKVLAAGLVPCGTSENPSPCTLCHLIIGFKNIFDYLLGTVLFPLFTLGIVISGVLYMVSSGNKSLVEKAKTAFTYSLMGAVVALTSWLLVNAVLSALGYKSVGNWWNYTCDTAQTQGPGTLGPGGATLPGTSDLTGKGCAGVVQNANAMVGWSYSKPNRMADGSADCSSVAYRSYSAAGCSLPQGNSDTYLSLGKNFSASQQSSLNAGDLLVYSGHVATCLNDGCTQVIGANSANGIYTKDSGYDIKNAQKVVKASDYCSGC